MKTFAKLASTFLLVWLFASPAMGCLLPLAQLTQEEMACCRHMGRMCDDMAKNTSHSCCQKVQTHNPSYVIAKAASTSIQSSPATPFSFAPVRGIVPVTLLPGSVPAEYGYPPGYSPPGLPELIAFRI